MSPHEKTTQLQWLARLMPLLYNVSVLNAGINKPLMFLDITEENWDMIMKVNGLGVLLGMQETAKQMIAQGKENGPYKIINVGPLPPLIF